MSYAENNLHYNLNIEAPWKQYIDRDVHNPNEAAKLLHDVEMQIANKSAAYMVFEHRLRVLPDMPKTLEECGPLMAELREGGQGIASGWRETAAMLRQMAKNKTDVALGHLQNEVARLQTVCAVRAQQAGAVVVEGEVDPKADLIKQLANLKRAEIESIKASKKLNDRTYSEEETAYAKEVTGDQKEAIIRDPKTIWDEVLKKILRTMLQAQNDDVVMVKWDAICRQRMEDCVAVEKTQLELAESLEKEARMFEWGMWLCPLRWKT
jgi:hypothetical protein